MLQFTISSIYQLLGGQVDDSLVKVWILALLYMLTPSFIEIFLGLKSQLVHHNLIDWDKRK